MRKILFLYASLATILLSLSFSLISASCNGCLYNNVCYSFGDTILVNGVPSYCNIFTKQYSPRLTNGSCMNDFECIDGYMCLSGNCSDLYGQLLENSQRSASFGNILDFCMGEDKFCYNSSSPMIGSINISGNCSFGLYAEEYICYSCNSTYYWNGSSCEIIRCDSEPGCLNKSSFGNASLADGFCENNFKCFACDAGYYWNGSICEEEPEPPIHYTDDGVPGSSFYWTTYIVTQSQFERGYTKELNAWQRLKISIDGLSHYVGVISLTSSTAKINVSSAPQQAIFSVKDSKKFEVTNDNYYDIKVTLNGIKNHKANITIISIHDTVNQQNNQNNQNNPPVIINPSNNDDSGKKQILFISILVGLVIIIIVVIIAIIYIVRKQTKPSSLKVIQPSQTSGFSQNPQNNQFRNFRNPNMQ